MEKLLLTVDEAADVLSIGRTALYELMGSGRLPWVTIGRSRRIPAAALAEFVDGLRAAAHKRDTGEPDWVPGDCALRPGPVGSCRCAANTQLRREL